MPQDQSQPYPVVACAPFSQRERQPTTCCTTDNIAFGHLQLVFEAGTPKTWGVHQQASQSSLIYACIACDDETRGF
jgi:hypothetical protein